MPNHLLFLFEAGIELAVSNTYIHIGEDWNRNREDSLTELTISDLFNNDATPQHFKLALKQKRKIGWEQFFMGKMTRG